MGVIAAIKRGARGFARGVRSSGDFWQAMDHPSWGAQIGSRKTVSGENVSPASAMKHSAYFACINRRSTDLATLPGCVEEWLDGSPDGRKKKLWKHPVTLLVNAAANPEQSGLTVRQTITAWMDGWGDGTAEIQFRRSGEPYAIWPIHPSRVVVDRDRTTGRDPKDAPLVYQVRMTDFSSRVPPETLDPASVLHVHGIGDGLRGYSKMRLADEVLGLGIGAQTFAAAFFGNDLSAGTAFTPLANMKPEDAKALKMLLQETIGGARNAWKVFLTNVAGKFERLNFNPAESQVLETRSFTVEDVCRFFDIHPAIIGHAPKAEGWQSFEGRQQVYRNDCLRPLARLWEDEIDRKLLFSDPDLHFRFDFRDLLRADHKVRSEYNEKKIQCGAMRPEEWRREDGDEETGDENAKKLWMKSGTVPLDVAAQPRQPVPPALGGPPEDDVDAPPPAEPPPTRASAPPAMKAVLEATAQRVARKEEKAFARAAAKFAGLSHGYLAWSAEFFEKVETDLVDEFGPALAPASYIGAWAKETARELAATARSEQERGVFPKGDARVARTAATILARLERASR